MPDCILGTAQGEAQAAVGAVQLAEFQPHQLLVWLAGVVCKHKCTDSNQSVSVGSDHSLTYIKRTDFDERCCRDGTLFALY